jgi:CheY-like chemotaxis protein
MSTKRIVLIEDNPADVLLVKKALEANGVACEMTQFDNGLEALKVLCPPDVTEANLFVPDAILLDLNTPKAMASTSLFGSGILRTWRMFRSRLSLHHRPEATRLAPIIWAQCDTSRSRRAWMSFSPPSGGPLK